MKTLLGLSAFLLNCISLVSAQGIDVRYDKNRDLSVYKTFAFGESEVITPADQRVLSETKLKSMVMEILEDELTQKGLTKVDSVADLTVSFIVGALDRSEVSTVGPFGGTPGQVERRSSVNEMKEGNLVVTLHDKSKHLIWKVNGTGSPEYNQPEVLIREIVRKGFKKFTLKPSRKKKK